MPFQFLGLRVQVVGVRFRDGQQRLVSFLVAVLLFTVPPCPAIKGGGVKQNTPVLHRTLPTMSILHIFLPATRCRFQASAIRGVVHISHVGAPALPFFLFPFLPFPSHQKQVPLLWLSDLRQRFSFPSGSGRSPATKRYLVNLRLKILPLVAMIFSSFSGNKTSNWGTRWVSGTVVTYLTFMPNFQFKFRSLRLYRVSHKNDPYAFFCKMSITNGTFSAKFYTHMYSTKIHMFTIFGV